MASKRKTAAARAVATAAPEAEAPLVVAETVAADAEQKPVVATEAATAEVQPKAVVEASAEAEAPLVVAEPTWPQRYRLTNNTRMPLHLPASYLVVEPFGKHTDFDAASEEFLKSLRCEIDAIAGLNGLDESVFVLEQIDKPKGE